MSDVTSLVESLHPHEAKVLAVVAAFNGKLTTDKILATEAGIGGDQLTAAIGRLEAKHLIEQPTKVTDNIVSLTETGDLYLVNGNPLKQIMSAAEAVRDTQTPLTITDLQTKLGLAPGDISGFVGLLRQEGAITIGSGGAIQCGPSSSTSAEALQRLLEKVSSGSTALGSFSPDEQALISKFAQKRGKQTLPFRVDERVRDCIYRLTEDGRAVSERLRQEVARDEATQLTPEMLKDGSWRNVKFRKYTIGLKPSRIAAGKKHPYREFLDLVKTKLVSMGFEEMRGGLVENEFWNMDALYMPQFHPARETHDVYFVKAPQHSSPIPEPFLSRVAQAHENGGHTGSTGWGYRFDRMRTRRLVLRSQGTAVSARTLAAKPKAPGKYFSIARCFRYDQVDATHAPDFFQIEGIVLGPDINFQTLLGLLTLFAREVAQAQEIRFTPAYFPFTEPSVELHVRHPRLGWMELGGAGLFRPEVIRPLGVESPVIAWGLGLDRMAMIALEIHDIRDLFSTDLEMIRGKRVQY